jgi:hypothetical protein
VVGALLALVANGLHPHPSEFNIQALLQEIGTSSAWTGVHLTLIFGLVLILGALLAITVTMEGEPGATVARFACLAAMVGGVLILTSTAMDGFGMNHIARAWLDAPAAEKAAALRIADGFENAQYAVYSLSVAIFLGLGIFLYGVATLLSSTFPRALGWLAIVAGAGAFVVGVAQTQSGPALRGTEIFFVVFSLLSTAWVFMMGVLMWRHARRIDAHAEIE